MIHIGKLIKEKIEADGRKTEVILDACGIKRQNMNNIYTRESIDTALLLQICKGLDYDFFRHYSAQIPFAKSEVSAPEKTKIHAIAEEFKVFVGKAEKIISKSE